MKKKTKKKLIISGIILLGILLAGILIYFGFFSQSFLNINEATTYGTVSYSKDVITYSDIDRQGSINGFTNTHRNSEYSATYFEVGAGNSLFIPYLEYNGIDSSNFNVGGYKPLVCVFTPKDITPIVPLYSFELTNLGFIYMSQQEVSYSSRGGDAGLCNYNGCCAECWVGSGCSGTLNRACENGGFKVVTVTGYNACWTKTFYDSSKLNDIASKMDCFVEGTVNSICTGLPVGQSDRCISFTQDYSIKGTVSYNNGFICEVDEAILKSQLPRTMIQPSDGLNKTVEKIGITGTVKFKVKEVTPPEQPVTYYRFADNTCTEISILPSLKTENDYILLSDCEDKIIKPIQWILYIAIGLIILLIIIGIILYIRRKK